MHLWRSIDPLDASFRADHLLRLNPAQQLVDHMWREIFKGRLCRCYMVLVVSFPCGIRQASIQAVDETRRDRMRGDQTLTVGLRFGTTRVAVIFVHPSDECIGLVRQKRKGEHAGWKQRHVHVRADDVSDDLSGVTKECRDDPFVKVEDVRVVQWRRDEHPQVRGEFERK